MKTRLTGRALAAVSLIVGLGITASGAVAGAANVQSLGHAVFVETDAALGNSVLSYARGANGELAYVGAFATGGLGQSAAGASADPLASQGGLSLINNDHELVATNPGSNSVTVFAVHGPHLSVLQQIPSGGQFPVSVASYGDLVAILNSGGTGSVAEFKLVNGVLVALADQDRSLGLANTTPPNFLDAPGQVGYTPDGQHLVVTTKLSTNSYDVFSVGANGALGETPVVTLADSPVPFAFNFDAAGHLVAVEAATSSLSTYVVNADGTLTSLGTVSDGAAALCWISSANGYFFGDNAGSASISSFDENSAGAPQLVNATAGTAHAGTTDSAISPDGTTLYVQSGGAGTLDVYRIGAGGTLTHTGSVVNIPVASEGIAAS